MPIEVKRHLVDIERIRVSENRNLEDGLRLDRNERVANWCPGFLAKAFADKPAWTMSVYPDSRLLYSKLARFHDVDADNILLTSGIDGGIKTLFEVICNEGDTFGVIEPTYAMYKVYARIFNLNINLVTYTADRKFNWPAFEQSIKEQPKLFFLPNPNQPIEDNFTLNRLCDMARTLNEIGCIFVIDEAYHMFGSVSGVSLINEFENVVVARTFSKGFGVPSIRLGYLISSSENIRRLSTTRFAHESNTLSNNVAEFLLDNIDQVVSYNDSVIEAREATKAKLAELGVSSFGDWGNYLLIEMPSNEVAAALVATLKDDEIYVKGPWSGDFDRFITITIGPFSMMEPFLAKLETFLHKTGLSV